MTYKHLTRYFNFYILINIYIYILPIPTIAICLFSVWSLTPLHISTQDPTTTRKPWYPTCSLLNTSSHNRAHTIQTWERIHTSHKQSSTYNRPHLVSDGYTATQLWYRSIPFPFYVPFINMARRVGLSRATDNKFGKQTFYSTRTNLWFYYSPLFSNCSHRLPSLNPCWGDHQRRSKHVQGCVPI